MSSPNFTNATVYIYILSISCKMLTLFPKARRNACILAWTSVIYIHLVRVKSLLLSPLLQQGDWKSLLHTLSWSSCCRDSAVPSVICFFLLHPAAGTPTWRRVVMCPSESLLSGAAISHPVYMLHFTKQNIPEERTEKRVPIDLKINRISVVWLKYV